MQSRQLTATHLTESDILKAGRTPQETIHFDFTDTLFQLRHIRLLSPA